MAEQEISFFGQKRNCFQPKTWKIILFQLKKISNLAKTRNLAQHKKFVLFEPKKDIFPQGGKIAVMFCQTLNKWCKQYSNPSLAEKLSEHQQIQLLGMSFNDTVNSEGEILTNNSCKHLNSVQMVECVPLINEKAMVAVKIMTEEPV